MNNCPQIVGEVGATILETKVHWQTSDGLSASFYGDFFEESIDLWSRGIYWQPSCKSF